MEITRSTSIGSIVANDYRYAPVFQKHGIDFCCKGNQTISEVCGSKSIDITTLLAELIDATKHGSDQIIDYRSWPIDLLADYIEKKHHRYIENAVPVLEQFLDKLCKAHVVQHPELSEIREEFHNAVDALAAHMRREEHILFPYVRNLVASTRGVQFTRPHFGSIANPIRMMMQEHDAEGERFGKIAALSNNYTPPRGSCTTYRVTYSLLKEFESDLHLHIHLENNILFPKAIEMENETFSDRSMNIPAMST